VTGSLPHQSDFAERLANLPTEDGWDSYGGKPTTEAARRTAENLTIVPTSTGGVQIELHAGGMDVEIEIDFAGQVSSVLVGQ
jgi:hypothetical protein